MLKKTILATFALSLATVANAMELTDTIADVKNPERVIINETDSLIKVSINGRENDSTFTFNYIKAVAPGTESITKEHSGKWDFTLPLGVKTSGRSHCEFSMGGIGFGFVSALNAPKDMDVDMLSSYEIFANLLNIHRFSGNNKHMAGIGFGINWKNFRMNGRTRFTSDNEGNIVFSPYGSATDPKFSRIKVFSLTLPVKYRYYFTKSVSASLSAILNFNTYASIKTRYIENGEKVKDMNKNIHQRPVSVDLQASLRWRSISIYAKYSPCSVLKSDFGPDFNAFSVGVILF